MWLKDKKMKGICFIILTFILILFSVFIIRFSERKTEVEKTVAVERFCNSEKAELALYYRLSNKIDGAADIFIRCWRKPESEDYYLFLPAGLSGKELWWMVSKDADVFVEDRKIETYDDFDLEEGRYGVRVVDNNEEYVYNLEVMYTSKVATFFFETESGALDFLHEKKENREVGNYCLLDEEGKVESAGFIRDIHGRGNVSWDNSKKPYQVTLEDKAALLGMPESRKWLLLPNSSGDTLTRNEVAYAISEGLGFAYTPRSEYAEVYANGEYLGLYSLTEKVEIDNNRVDIRDLEKEMERMNDDVDLSTFEFFMEDQGRLYSTKGYRIPKQPENITGGYLLELEMLDRYGLEASGFITSRMQGVIFNSPKYASFEQVSYIANMYQDFEDAMYSESGYSPYTGKHFSEYIDIELFASKYLLEELVKNLDASYTSQFFYKPENSDKIFAGPVWDYDKAIAGYGVTLSGIDLHVPEQIYAASEKEIPVIYGLVCVNKNTLWMP